MEEKSRGRSQELETWRATAGVTVLAEAQYAGPDTADTVYTALFSDLVATARYDEVYDRAPRQFVDGNGEIFAFTPPPRFGQMG